MWDSGEASWDRLFGASVVQLVAVFWGSKAPKMAAFINWRSFVVCGCLHDKSPSIWDLY